MFLRVPSPVKLEPQIYDWKSPAQKRVAPIPVFEKLIACQVFSVDATRQKPIVTPTHLSFSGSSGGHNRPLRVRRATKAVSLNRSKVREALQHISNSVATPPRCPRCLSGVIDSVFPRSNHSEACSSFYQGAKMDSGYSGPYRIQRKGYNVASKTL